MGADGAKLFSKCSMYDSSAGNDPDTNITDCLYGWEWDLSIVSSSIVIDVFKLKHFIQFQYLFSLFYSMNSSVPVVFTRQLVCHC